MPQKKRSKKHSTQGKKNRAAGTRFEYKVRNDLESDEKGWVTDRWANNVDFENGEGKLVKAKRKYNPYSRALSIGTGFPDFICFKVKGKGKSYEVIGVEVKRNGYLDKDERVKCKWLLKNKIFSKILVAKENKEGRNVNIEYIDFIKKYDTE